MEQKRQMDEAELRQLKEALNRSYQERFEMATRLYKVQKAISKNVISHKPFIYKSDLRP